MTGVSMWYTRRMAFAGMASVGGEVAQPTDGGLIPGGGIEPEPLPLVQLLGKRDYCGDHIYLNDTIERVLTPVGYYNDLGDHFAYVKDWQGNVRVTVDQNGNVIEAVDYYPYGMVMENGNEIATDAQPYKYGGKELDRRFGYDSYDFEARVYDPALGRFNQPDPLAWDTPDVSPYVYCAANPIRYVDPTGMDTYEVNSEGYLTLIEKQRKTTEFHMVDNYGKRTGKSISFNYNDVKVYVNRSFQGIDLKTNENINIKYDIFKVKGDDNSTSLFEFFADNVTSASGNEYSHIKTGTTGKNGNFITTSHMNATDPGMSALFADQLFYGYTIREHIHSHPNNPTESPADREFVEWVAENRTTIFNLPAPLISYKIYFVRDKRYRSYTKLSNN